MEVLFAKMVTPIVIGRSHVVTVPRQVAEMLPRKLFACLDSSTRSVIYSPKRIDNALCVELRLRVVAKRNGREYYGLTIPAQFYRVLCGEEECVLHVSFDGTKIVVTRLSEVPPRPEPR